MPARGPRHGRAHPSQVDPFGASGVTAGSGAVETSRSRHLLLLEWIARAVGFHVLHRALDVELERAARFRHLERFEFEAGLVVGFVLR